MFQVINKSQRLMFVPRKSGAMVAINPGASRQVDIATAMAQHLRKIEMRGGKGALKVEGLTDEDRAMLDKVTPGKRPDDEARQEPEAKPHTASRAMTLMAEIDDISFPEFRRRAKEILGDRYPAGTPSKEDLVELLQGN